MKIIPAIDIIDGQCVRLSKGDYDTKKVYNSNPLEVAKEFEDFGIEYLHVVDLDGAKSSKVVNFDVLEAICSKTNLKVDFGGGVKSDEDIKRVFECGAKQVTGGSIAVKNPQVFERWLKEYGSDKIILGADVKEEKIAINGWLEESDLMLIPFLKDYLKKGAKTIICTDVAKDGMLQGTSNELYKKIQQEVPEMNIIASGGVSNMKDLEILADMNMYGVILGKAIYEGRISMKELSEFKQKVNK